MISCPACAGVLRVELGKHGPVRFVCSVGHAFSLQDLYQAKEDNVEQFEWSVVALLKHIQMILGLLKDTGEEPENFSARTIRARDEQVREHIVAIEQIIHKTQTAVRIQANTVESFPGDST